MSPSVLLSAIVAIPMGDAFAGFAANGTFIGIVYPLTVLSGSSFLCSAACVISKVHVVCASLPSPRLAARLRLRLQGYSFLIYFFTSYVTAFLCWYVENPTTHTLTHPSPTTANPLPRSLSLSPLQVLLRFPFSWGDNCSPLFRATCNNVCSRLRSQKPQHEFVLNQGDQECIPRHSCRHRATTELASLLHKVLFGLRRLRSADFRRRLSRVKDGGLLRRRVMGREPEVGVLRVHVVDCPSGHRPGGKSVFPKSVFPRF